LQARGRHSWSRRHACWTWSQQQAWLVGGGSLHRAPAAEDTSEPKHTFHGGLAADRLAAVIAQRKAVRSRGHGGVPWSSLSMWPISAVFSAFSSEHDSCSGGLNQGEAAETGRFCEVSGRRCRYVQRRTNDGPRYLDARSTKKKGKRMTQTGKKKALVTALQSSTLSQDKKSSASDFRVLAGLEPVPDLHKDSP
jgi:hypothetical protein